MYAVIQKIKKKRITDYDKRSIFFPKSLFYIDMYNFNDNTYL